MADRIRFRAWLLGLGPVVVVVGVLVALFAGSSKKPAPLAIATSSEPAPSAPEVVAATVAAPSVAVPAAPPAPSVAAPTVPSVVAPEPIPELDAFWRAKGSEQWTTEQRVAFREQAYRALDAKELSLVQEIARARRRGDTQTVEQKQATLDFLRARRAEIDKMMERSKLRDTNRDAPLDAGSPGD
jgi:hypothetical protein